MFFYQSNGKHCEMFVIYILIQVNYLVSAIRKNIDNNLPLVRTSKRGHFSSTLTEVNIKR